jgi:hypothetical protein
MELYENASEYEMLRYLIDVEEVVGNRVKLVEKVAGSKSDKINDNRIAAVVLAIQIGVILFILKIK